MLPPQNLMKSSSPTLSQKALVLVLTIYLSLGNPWMLIAQDSLQGPLPQITLTDEEGEVISQTGEEASSPTPAESPEALTSPANPQRTPDGSLPELPAEFFLDEEEEQTPTPQTEPESAPTAPAIPDDIFGGQTPQEEATPAPNLPPTVPNNLELLDVPQEELPPATPVQPQETQTPEELPAPLTQEEEPVAQETPEEEAPLFEEEQVVETVREEPEPVQPSPLQTPVVLEDQETPSQEATPTIAIEPPTPEPTPTLVPDSTPTPQIAQEAPATPTPAPQPTQVPPQVADTETAPAPQEPSRPVQEEEPSELYTEEEIAEAFAREANRQEDGTLPPENTEENLKEVEDLLRQFEQRSQELPQRQTFTPPNLKRNEHVYEDVPLAKALRILAEQAGINFIEPPIRSDELITFRLQDMTPLEAFMNIAESRGYRVVTNDNYTTLTRPDIVFPTFLITRQYPLKHVDPYWTLQSVANLLNITVETPSDVLATVPPPEDTSTGSGGGGTTGGGTTGGDTGTSGSGTGSTVGGNVGLPENSRWTSALPYDAPLNTGAAAGEGQQEPWVFIDRKTNSLIVHATKEDQVTVKRFLKEYDNPEPLIAIDVKIVEVILDDQLLQGIDWRQPFQQGITFGLTPTTNLGNTENQNTEGDSANFLNILTFANNAYQLLGTPSTLFLDSSTLQATLRNFQELQIGSIVSQPRVYTKNGVPVSIRDTTVQSIPVNTPQSNTGATPINTTQFETFTTGLTMDLIPRLFNNGNIDININPAVANQTGSTPPTPEYPSGIPIINERSLTTAATIRSGMTVVIGGLNTYQKADGDGGVPPFNRIPFLGDTVFGNKNNEKTKRTLLVFVTPKIIYPNQYERVYTGRDENIIMRESERNASQYETEPMPNGGEGVPIKRAIPIERTIRVQP